MNTNPTTTTHRHTLVLTSVTARDFTVAASTVWNSLSINIPSADRFASLNFPYTLLNCLHRYLRHLGRFSAITSALRFVFCATYRTRSLSVVVVQVTLAKCQSSHPTDRQTDIHTQTNLKSQARRAMQEHRVGGGCSLHRQIPDQYGI